MIFCPRTCLNANTKQPAVPLGAVQEVEKLKRNLLAAAATSSILALAAPPLALAQGNHHHHHHGARHASTQLFTQLLPGVDWNAAVVCAGALVVAGGVLGAAASLAGLKDLPE